jgi:8-oxo-dGTP pyrophosphatase MutT (NUDIX family)
MVERLRCHVTVAAVIERDGRYLFVEERIAGQRVLNQPAGHLEAGEDLHQAVIREVREETGLEFSPEAWLGCELLTLSDGAVILRVAFTGRAAGGAPVAERDPAILGTHWLTAEEAIAWGPLRSPLVLRSLERHQTGLRLPLETLGPLLSAVS